MNARPKPRASLPPLGKYLSVRGEVLIEPFVWAMRIRRGCEKCTSQEVLMKLSAPIYRLNRLAKILSRDEGLPLHEALDRIAAQEGFARWNCSHRKWNQLDGLSGFLIVCRCQLWVVICRLLQFPQRPYSVPKVEVKDQILSGSFWPMVATRLPTTWVSFGHRLCENYSRKMKVETRD